jgi:hypothetical protein
VVGPLVEQDAAAAWVGPGVGGDLGEQFVLEVAGQVAGVEGLGALCAVVQPPPAREGYLAKLPVDYSRIGRFEMPLTDFTSYTADDRVKLSVHKDGFVQFSGEDPGENPLWSRPYNWGAKGLGIVANRLKM